MKSVHDFYMAFTGIRNGFCLHVLDLEIHTVIKGEISKIEKCIFSYVLVSSKFFGIVSTFSISSKSKCNCKFSYDNSHFEMRFYFKMNWNCFEMRFYFNFTLKWIGIVQCSAFFKKCCLFLKLCEHEDPANIFHKF